MSFAFEQELESVDDDITDDMDDEFENYFDDEDYLALGIDPAYPTDAKPGSEQKVVMLAARYAAGLPLWHTEDRYDHGPGQVDVLDLAGSDQPFEEDE